jgi:hypothetical protein
MASDELDDLIERWGEDNVAAAFWLQQHIKEEGLEGIGFMKAARSHLEETGESTTKQNIESALDSRY